LGLDLQCVAEFGLRTALRGALSLQLRVDPARNNELLVVDLHRWPLRRDYRPTRPEVAFFNQSAPDAAQKAGILCLGGGNVSCSTPRQLDGRPLSSFD